MLVKAISQNNQVTYGRVYVVYALNIIEGRSYFYVVEFDEFSGPSQIVTVFFEILDTRVSMYWSCDFLRIEIDKIVVRNFGVSFKEWVEDPEFYHKLFEGEAVPGLFTDEEAKEAIQIFQRYKALMDLEFALPSITKYAINLESDNWVMCPTCDEAWQDENATIHEMVKCPKCCEKWLSPLKKA